MTDGWKIATIILAVVSALLFIALIIETVVLVALFVAGAGLEDMEDECANEVCGEQGYTVYRFDDYEEMCYCYSGDEVVVQQKVDW